MTRRADRLFDVIQVLRRAQGPMTGAQIAEELEVSKRTVYRDIATLMSRRVPIRGEPGSGYVLDRAFDMPPLALTPDEVEAVILGAQWVATHADMALGRAAANVLSKIAHVVPQEHRALIDDPVVGTPPRDKRSDEEGVDIARLREWCQKGKKIAISYCDREGTETERTVWPFLVGYQDGVRVVLAWCELREDFRAFRLERITTLTFLDAPYPEHAPTLRRRFLLEFRAANAKR